MTRLWPEGEPVETWGGDIDPGQPAGFRWQSTAHSIVEICNRWRIHARWWEPKQTIWREYVKVTTDSGFLCLLYRDLIRNNWFLARIYD